MHLDDVITYTIFPNVHGLFEAFEKFNVYEHVGLSYFAVLGIALGVSFLCSVFDTKF